MRNKIDFSQIPYLEQLYMSECGISKLRYDIFDPLKRLKELELDGNNISELYTYHFEGLDNLTYLNLKRNKLNVTMREELAAMYHDDLDVEV